LTFLEFQPKLLLEALVGPQGLVTAFFYLLTDQISVVLSMQVIAVRDGVLSRFFSPISELIVHGCR
jgi:hypothetical protein